MQKNDPNTTWALGILHMIWSEVWSSSEWMALGLAIIGAILITSSLIMRIRSW